MDRDVLNQINEILDRHESRAHFIRQAVKEKLEREGVENDT